MLIGESGQTQRREVCLDTLQEVSGVEVLRNGLHSICELGVPVIHMRILEA